MNQSYYIIEALRNSTVRFSRDPISKIFCYRRSAYTTFPNHYGFIEHYDSSGNIIKNSTEEQDFYLISHKDLAIGTAIKDKDLTKVLKLRCIDLKTNETDDKLVVVLNNQKSNMSYMSLFCDIDNIISFLICRRSKFRIKGVVFYDETPPEVKNLYSKIDWSNNLLWPKDYHLPDPDILPYPL